MVSPISSSTFTQNAAARTTGVQQLVTDLQKLQQTGNRDGSVKQDVQALQAMGLDMQQIQGGVRKSGLRLPPPPGQGIPLTGSDALLAAS